jgi:hypothetical protein
MVPAETDVTPTPRRSSIFFGVLLCVAMSKGAVCTTKPMAITIAMTKPK